MNEQQVQDLITKAEAVQTAEATIELMEVTLAAVKKLLGNPEAFMEEDDAMNLRYGLTELGQQVENLEACERIITDTWPLPESFEFAGTIVDGVVTLVALAAEEVSPLRLAYRLGYGANSEAFVAGYNRRRAGEGNLFWRYPGPDRVAYHAGMTAAQRDRARGVTR